MAKFIHVVLRAPKQRYKLFIHAKGVSAALAGNPTYAGLDLGPLDASIKALEEAETVSGLGAASALAAARELVRQELDHLRDQVQRVLEGQTDTVDLLAIQAMAESAGMDLRRVVPRARAVFAARYGDAPGSVKLTAPASRKRDTHEWEHSTDLITWTALPGTRQASTTVTDLPIGVAHHFRHCLLTKDGYTAWSDPTVMIVVK
jgi:hypothetical protein